MDLKISRVLHAGYIFEYDTVRIIFDPIFTHPFSRNCYAFPEVEFNHDLIKKQKFSAVFISHFHEDHCCLESLNLLNRNTPIYIYCQHLELTEMIESLGFQVTNLYLNKKIALGPFTINPLKALDPEIDAVFHISVAGLNILNVVDAWIDPVTLDFIKQESWDLVLWPFQTLREIEILSPENFEPSDSKIPEEWLEQLSLLNPKYIVPSSCQFIHEDWSWYNQALFPISYKSFKEQIKKTLPLSEVIKMNPGNEFILNQDQIIKYNQLLWVTTLADENIDYNYDSNVLPQKTSEIAKNFSILNEHEKNKIHNYCISELPLIYHNLPITDELCLLKNCIWRLITYDQDGSETIYDYNVNYNNLNISTTSGSDYQWLTEVPGYKLYAALTSGESLTSMYLRINADREIKNVDILQDPLIRCLFSHEFGLYHKEQLKKITNQIKLQRKKNEN